MVKGGPRGQVENHRGVGVGVVEGMLCRGQAACCSMPVQLVMLLQPPLLLLVLLARSPHSPHPKP